MNPSPMEQPKPARSEEWLDDVFSPQKPVSPVPPPIPSPTEPPTYAIGVTSPGAIEGDNTGGLIPYKNPQALTAYYIGLFSLIPVAGLVMGPAAVWLGIRGLKFAKENPVVKGKVHAWIGIVCGSLWALVNWGGLILTLVALFASR